VTATIPDPVAIFSHPDDTLWRLDALARYAITEQRAPLVLHPGAQPWLRNDDGTLAPHADPVGRALLGLVARHSGGRLWLLLRDGEPRDPWPRWCLGTVREWQNRAGRMPSRIRAAAWADWRIPDSALALGTVDHGDESVQDEADRLTDCLA